MDNPGQARALAVLISAALLGGAYLSQYGFGLFPCEMCWWQRYPHFAALGLGLMRQSRRRCGPHWPASRSSHLG